MRIVVEPSDYVLLNAGDAAMLEVAMTRLSALRPDDLGATRNLTVSSNMTGKHRLFLIRFAAFNKRVWPVGILQGKAPPFGLTRGAGV